MSRSGFDKQEFMDNVKDSVNDQYKEEQKSRTSSPQWLPAANKEKNHTGEQPLILQHFLAANKVMKFTIFLVPLIVLARGMS